MKTKKTIKILLLSLLVTLTLAACGRGNTDLPPEDGTTSGSLSTSESTTAATTQTPKTVYSVAPNIAWARATRERPGNPVTVGDSVNAFAFPAIDISGMDYLEFDIYLPSTAKLSNITKSTQLEITSSGVSDMNEVAWGSEILEGQSLVDGWNHIKLALPEMEGVDKTAVNYIRWYWTESGSRIRNCYVANLRFTTEGSVEPENIGLPVASGFLVDTVYPTADTVVAAVDITKEPYNADNTGKTDVTDIINKALLDVRNMGGGTVWMPVGSYLVSDTVTIPTYCTLRGDWQDPDLGQEYGTVILARQPQGLAADQALFLIGGSAGVNGLTVYYPDQSLDNVREYPFTFYTNGVHTSYMLSSVTNCTVINGYRGLGACVTDDSVHEMFSVDNVKGTFLSVGAEMYNQADVGTWKALTVSPKYWMESTLGSPVDGDALRAYTKANTIGLILGDLEWTEFAELKVEDCKYGINIVKGKRIEFAGSFYGAEVKNCDIALKVDHLDDRWGLTVVNSRLEGSLYSIENNSMGMVKTLNADLVGPVGGSGKTENDYSDYARSVSIDFSEPIGRPNAELYLYSGYANGTRDLSAEIQALLDEAGRTGGVVYLPSGVYLLEAPITVPAGVELRGSAGSPTRDVMAELGGTVLLSRYGTGKGFGPDDTALITLGQDSGIRGIRIVFGDNGPIMFSENGQTNDSVYAVRGRGSGVYVVNCSIIASAYGVDFTDCDGHYIKKLLTCCYYNAMTLGGDGGRVEGCLQNGTVLTRMSADMRSYCGNMIDESEIFLMFNEILRPSCRYIVIKEGRGQLVFNTFAYGVCDLITNDGGEGVRIVSVGSDNIGGTQTVQIKGDMTVLGALRYNGLSYRNESGTLRLYARLTINDKSEQTVEEISR